MDPETRTASQGASAEVPGGTGCPPNLAPGLRVLPPHRGPSRGGPLKAPPKVLSAQVTLWLPFYIENTSSNAPPTHHSVYLSVVFFFFF